jgi:hypothetical protein
LLRAVVANQRNLLDLVLGTAKDARDAGRGVVDRGLLS